MDSSRRERAGGVEWTEPRGAKGCGADPRTAVWRMGSFGAAERGGDTCVTAGRDSLQHKP